VQTFLAANNLVIETDETQWLLKSNTPLETGHGSPELDPLLVHADADGLTYHVTFARARRLPEAGLKPYQIEMVIVGWENSVWQLGVLLAPHLASQRGGRWCGIAKWADATASQPMQAETARHAGEMLAYALQKPFQFVPAAINAGAAPAAEHNAPVSGATTYTAGPVTATRSLLTPANRETTARDNLEVALPSLPDVPPLNLPLTSGGWTLSEINIGLRWQRSAAWRRGMLVRGVFFALLALVFAYLAFGELRSAFAPVQPEWLPILGIIVMILMLVQALLRFAALWTTGSIEFDRRNRLVRVIRRPTGVLRQIPFEKIAYVLVSEQPIRRTRIGSLGESAEVERFTAEAWIHLKRDKGDYLPVAYLPEIDGRRVVPTGIARLPRLLLTEHMTDCAAFRAAIGMAAMIEVPAYLEDKR
jgi:hypothetical protein